MKRFHSDGIFPFSLFIPLPSLFGEGLGGEAFSLFTFHSPPLGEVGRGLSFFIYWVPNTTA